MKELLKKHKGKMDKNGAEFKRVNLKLLKELIKNEKVEMVDFGFNLNKTVYEEKQFYIKKDGVIREEYTDRQIPDQEIETLIQKYKNDCLAIAYFKD